LGPRGSRCLDSTRVQDAAGIATVYLIGLVCTTGAESWLSGSGHIRPGWLQPDRNAADAAVSMSGSSTSHVEAAIVPGAEGRAPPWALTMGLVASGLGIQ
jgi:hypothetical protein